MIILEDCSLYEYTPKVKLTFGAFDCGDEAGKTIGNTVEVF